MVLLCPAKIEGIYCGRDGEDEEPSDEPVRGCAGIERVVRHGCRGVTCGFPKMVIHVMSLAQHLAELTAANAKGLLTDDEFRILRQSAFDEYPQSQTSPPIPANPPLRRKKSIVSSVTTLFRRATTHTKPPPPDAPTNSPSPTDPSKLGVIPRLHRKASSLFAPDAPSLPPPKNHVPSPKPHDIYPLTSDIFDDRNLRTTSDIRVAISTTETEARRLLDAFNCLESSTSFRVQQQPMRRPSRVNLILAGTEWHDHSPPSPALSGSLTSPVSLLSDGVSLHSRSSSHKSITIRSRSKSLSSLKGTEPCTTVRIPTRPSITRKLSASSITSQTPSHTSRHTTARSLSISKGTSHLALGVLPEGEIAEDDQYAKISEVQWRREDVMARYDARLAYLRARLKSAELHEKLLRS